MKTRVLCLIMLVAALALVVAGCGGDDNKDKGSNGSAATTSGGTSGGSSGGDFDSASKSLCRELEKASKNVPSAPATGDPQGAIDAAKANIKFQTRVVDGLKGLPKPDDAKKATALKKFISVNEDILEATKQTLAISQKAVDDPQAAAADAPKLAELAKKISAKGADVAKYAEDLDLGNCSG